MHTVQKVVVAQTAHRHNLPDRGGLLQPAPYGEANDACLGCCQKHQQNKGSQNDSVALALDGGQCDIRHCLEMCHDINGA